MIQEKQHDASIRNPIENAKNHNRLHHYTSFAAILQILRNKKIRLSNLKNLNDPVEYERLKDYDPFIKDKIFAFCLNYENIDSIPLWKQYTPSPYGIRISLSPQDWSFTTDLKKYTAGFASVDLPFPSWKPWSMGSEKHDAILAQIHYDDDLQKYIKEDKRIPDLHLMRPILAGMLKTTAWSYECEVRVVSRVWCKSLKESIDTNKPDNDRFKSPPFSFLYCSIPDEIIPKLEILFNPAADDILIEGMKTAINAIAPNIPDENFKKSALRFK